MNNLPPDIVRNILSFTPDLRVLHIFRDMAQIPDTYWKNVTSQFQRDPLKHIKGSPSKPLAWHFKYKVIPLLCGGCGATTDCEQHAIFECRVCAKCKHQYKYRVISMTAACRTYLLRRSQLPKGGVMVQAYRYKCKLYLVSEVEKVVNRVYGSVKALRRWQHKQKQLRRERQQLKMCKANQLNAKRMIAYERRKQKLEASLPHNFEEILDSIGQYDHVVGDFLSTDRQRPLTTLKQVVERFRQLT